MNIYYELYKLKYKIPKNTYRTILGQLKAGDFKGASKGIERIKKRLGGTENGNQQIQCRGLL